MKNILIVGAGRSSSALIQYLLDYAATGNITITVGDVTMESAFSKTGNHPNSRAIKFDVNDEQQRIEEIKTADLVISLLPPHLHMKLAVDCVKSGKHFLTASYLTPDMKQLDEDAKKNGILVLNECGLDPGIDHMSAVKCIQEIQSSGGELLSFKSYTGGLIAPESNNNPWNYKFTWNPRNVILAGQGTAKYKLNGRYKYIPYNRLYRDIEIIKVAELGNFDGYANRDSLTYREHYGIKNIPTIVRGTLRNTGFCRAWDVFVQLGLTDDTYVVENSQSITYKDLVEGLLPSKYQYMPIEEAVADFCGLPVDGEAMTKIIWTGIFEEEVIGTSALSPAAALQQLLEKKWSLKEHDIDMIVMQHEFEYKLNNENKKMIASLVVKGTDSTHTAMAKTVGLPLAIVAKLIFEKKINLSGVLIPIQPEIYLPVLEELEHIGVKFNETVA